MVRSRKCVACGTKYSYCPDCSRADAQKPTWYNDFCQESCKDLWYTLSRYNMGRITKEDAKSVILELDLNPIESYSQFVQRDYAKVMTDERKPKRGKRTEMPIVYEATDIPQDVVDSIIQNLVEIKIEQPDVPDVKEELAVHEVVLQENK